MTERNLSHRSRCRALRAALGKPGPRPLLLLGHNYPDPDCLGAALGLQALLSAWGFESLIAFGGGLGRAENRAMAGLLGIAPIPFAELRAADYAGLVAVDTQPGAGNAFFPEGVPIRAVFDHHHPPADPPAPEAFRDIRPGCGATCTLVHGYLKAEKVPLDARLAAALLLGIRTDTEDLARDASEADLAAYVRLLPLADRVLLRAVLQPPLSEEYFGLLRTALRTARRWDAAVVASLGPLPAPDLLSEVSGLFIRLKGVELSLAIGTFEGSVYLSLRSARAARKGTLDLIRSLVGSEGSAGGHGRAAGGKLTPRDGDAEGAAAAVASLFVEGIGAVNGGPRPVCLSPEEESAP